METLFLLSIIFSLTYIDYQSEKEARRNRRFRSIDIDNLAKNDFVQNDFIKAA